MILRKAETSQVNQIFALYEKVIAGVAKTSVNLGWNTAIYPSLEWIQECVARNEMLLFCEEKIIGACAVNYSVNDEYNQIDSVKGNIPLIYELIFTILTCNLMAKSCILCCWFSSSLLLDSCVVLL